MPLMWLLYGAVLLIACVAVYDLLQTKHAILRIYPVIGHLRYLLEMIGPELRQYWVANDKEELPFNRSERGWIYSTAKGQNNYFGFGTTELQYTTGYPIIKNATLPLSDERPDRPYQDPTTIPCTKIMGAMHGRRRPYRPRSIVNISGMSYGALGSNAIRALNSGARIAGCYHDTGEGGVSPHHLLGADLVWQIGTGYFGARDQEGNFSKDVVAERVAKHPSIRAILLKLSQGAKPGKGGVLPAAKVVPEIAEARGVPAYENCLSPNAHSAFSSVEELIDLVEEIAECTGLPVGVKAAVGETAFWEELARRMRERGQGPDFFQIDGGEGGTGAAPLTHADHVSLPFKIAFTRVYQIFQREGLSEGIVWLGSGKLGFPDRAVVALAMGCDLIAIAREAMMSLGCIQSLSCHTGRCPTGIATMSSWRQAGLNVDRKALRVAMFMQGFRRELLSLAHTAGYEHPSQFTLRDIEVSTGVNTFSTQEQVLGYMADPVQFTSWPDITVDEDPDPPSHQVEAKDTPSRTRIVRSA